MYNVADRAHMARCHGMTWQGDMEWWYVPCACEISKKCGTILVKILIQVSKCFRVHYLKSVSNCYEV